MKKENKKNFSKEEKAERKRKNKYKVFRNKILAIVCSILLVVGAVCSVLGFKFIEQDIMYYLSILGTWLTVLLPFFIFKRPTLALMTIGTVCIDIALISDNSEPMGLGIVAFLISLISIAIGMKIRNKRNGNYNIKLDYTLTAAMVGDEDGNIEKTLDYGCFEETLYKAHFYFVAGIVSSLACGIGLLLPFGLKAYKYYKALGMLTGEIKEIQSSRYDEDKPFKNLVLKNELYFGGKTFSSKSNFYNVAGVCQIFSFGYIIISTILNTIIRKPTSMDEDATTAGTVAFSTNSIEGLDPNITHALASYSKKQTEESRQYFLDALQNLSDSYDEWSAREGARLQAYEQEKWRSARKYGQDSDVFTDGQNYYAKDPYTSGDAKKLEDYDKTTGVGHFTDENGKKVEIRNKNVKK